MLSVALIRGDRIEPGPVDAPSLAAVLADAPVRLWVDVEQPTADEYELLSSAFNFHPLAIEDCRVENELPKLDDYGYTLFIVLHSPDHQPESFSLTTIEHHFFLNERYLVTVHDRPSPVIADFRREALLGSAVFTRGMDVLLHAMTDRVADQYVRLLDEFDGLTDELERRVVSQPKPDVLESIFVVKRSLLHLVRFAHLQRDVVHRLSREPFPQIAESTRLYFRDVYDHLFQVSTMAEFYRDRVAGVRDAYLSVVSNRLAETMKVLTRFATVVLPLTVITGIYGMNFDHMPELHWRYGYPSVLVGMAVLALGLVWWFRRRGW